MAITSSAVKALRASKRKRVFNVRRMDAVKDVTKEIKKLVSEGKKADAQVKLSAAYKAIDKAAKMFSINKNSASRKKSRLAAIIRKGETKKK
jgi:small subunit ribosomal protein S20